MNLMGKKVRHRVYGIGEIIEQDENNIIIKFQQKEAKFPLAKNTFISFLTFELPSDHNEVLAHFQEIEDQAAREEQARRQAEAERRAEAARLAEEQRAQQLRNRQRTGMGTSAKQHVPFQRTEGIRETFFVFQGAMFEEEYRGGYIWAPVETQDGRRVFHWESLLDVRPGDIIFNGCNGSIMAISEAEGECYDCPQPEELRTADLWEPNGRRVDCTYFRVDNPIKTALVRDDIIRLCQTKYSPFDRNGDGNQGYLFHLNRELAHIFLDMTIRQNPKLKDIDFIRDLLSEKQV